MPFGDKTGPMGQGSMTGRGLGFCSGFSAPGYTKPSFGRGRGFRNWYRATGLTGWQRARMNHHSSSQQEKEMLTGEKEAIQSQIKALEKQMKGLEERLGEIKKKK